MPNLMIVAHPDDEVLFGGAQLLTGKWTVLCVTNGDHPIRRKEFERVMEFVGCNYEIWNFPDRQFDPLPSSLELTLDTFFRFQSWDKVLTHNQYGEYGHLHHRQLNGLVKKLAPVRNLWHFNCHRTKPLEESLWARKLELMALYESQKEIVDFFLNGDKQTVGGYSDYNIRNEIISQEHFLV